MNEKENYNHIPMLDKACSVIKVISDNGGEAGISQISKTTDLSKSTIFRILYTLQENGIVEKNPSNERYKLGIFFLKAGEQVKCSINLGKVSEPVMEQLSKETGETINIGVPYENGALIIESVYGEASLLVSNLDPLFPLYCSGIGKVLMCRFTQKELESYFSDIHLTSRTINTIVDLNSMKAELSKIKAQGYSIDNEENEYGLLCIAAPIYDASGRLIAGISASGPVSRMYKVKGVDEIRKAVVAAAATISRKLGYE